MSVSLLNRYSPELKVFVVSALFFLDLGVLFGALNAFRLAKLFPYLQIDLTHWTSTLLGGVSILMLGQILFFLSYIGQKQHRLHFLQIAVLALWVLGIISNYLAAWIDY